MALYEDDSMVLRNPGEAPPEGFTLKGQMGPVGQEQDYYERAKSPTVEQPQMAGTQSGQMPPGGNINQFLDWAVKTKLGFNPFTMNPTMEALKTWNQNESEYFNQAFSGTGITPNNMTPEALKHWNEQRREGMAAIMSEAEQKQKNAIAYLAMLKQGWEEANTVAGRLELPTGEKALINKFGQKIRNADARDSNPSGGDAGLGQMVAGPGAPTGTNASTVGGRPTRAGGGGEFLTEPAKVEKPPTSAEERKRVVDTKVLMMISDKAEEILKKPIATEWVGPYSGRVGQMKEKITDLPEDQIELYATLRDINDFVLRIRSGAQINESEYKRLTNFLMDINLPKNTLDVRLKRFKEATKWMEGLVEREMGKTNTTAPEAPKKSKYKILEVK